MVIFPVPVGVAGEAVLVAIVVKLHWALPLAAVLIEAVYVLPFDRLSDGVNVAVFPLKATVPCTVVFPLPVTVNVVVATGGAVAKAAVMRTFTDTSIAFALGDVEVRGVGGW